MPSPLSLSLRGRERGLGTRLDKKTKRTLQKDTVPLCIQEVSQRGPVHGSFFSIGSPGGTSRIKLIVAGVHDPCDPLPVHLPFYTGPVS